MKITSYFLLSKIKISKVWTDMTSSDQLSNCLKMQIPNLTIDLIMGLMEWGSKFCVFNQNPRRLSYILSFKTQLLLTNDA